MEEKDFEIEFPECEGDVLSQDQEYCLVRIQGRTERIRLHDYHEIYRIPGLYECLFCKRLQYRSPEVVVSLLMGEVEKSSFRAHELSVLDIGAGNGLAGEWLRAKGVTSIVGMDIVPEALKAVRRDRPDVYDEYYVEDLIGLEVVNGAQVLGRVTSSREQGGIEVLAVTGDEQELEIPFVEQYVIAVDIDRGRIEVREVDDLPRSRIAGGGRGEDG